MAADASGDGEEVEEGGGVVAAVVGVAEGVDGDEVEFVCGWYGGVLDELLEGLEGSVSSRT